jgi:hypothetical protein
MHKDLLEAESEVKQGLIALLLDLEQARKACWAQGFGLDTIHELMGSCGPFGGGKTNILKSKEDNEKCENLTEIWNEILGEKGARVWSTKKRSNKCMAIAEYGSISTGIKTSSNISQTWRNA